MEDSDSIQTTDAEAILQRRQRILAEMSRETQLTAELVDNERIVWERDHSEQLAQLAQRRRSVAARKQSLERHEWEVQQREQELERLGRVLSVRQERLRREESQARLATETTRGREAEWEMAVRQQEQLLERREADLRQKLQDLQAWYAQRDAELRDRESVLEAGRAVLRAQESVRSEAVDGVDRRNSCISAATDVSFPNNTLNLADELALHAPAASPPPSPDTCASRVGIETQLQKECERLHEYHAELEAWSRTAAERNHQWVKTVQQEADRWQAMVLACYNVWAEEVRANVAHVVSQEH
ncbi:hypothetical protein BAUCODRAFT_331329 [Baudoinia panamericana UAMH 10762]|uniref:Uncharacterized protein n=1 Tax=Baudoinia panamericana (strain UAMH 10762) TaxID=717646 RepID=M2LAT1_BAUPA|nr:uncharacterized protein BAUCODRAFT_331329 [Baudoinia panamericana UAMH 10762]EMC90922.1 hypothetical protein BAUCODRAFT_331329 [Baudoinia panamericana UAMH 10762]